jgi:hypothetical protein
MTPKPPTKLLRFADLKDRGIVSNWPQLKRLQDTAAFPPGYLLSPNARVWDEHVVETWLAARREVLPRSAA